jgi:spore germination cell wall hydrolase CwlJ-like protein
MTPEQRSTFLKLSALQIVALTIFGEAEGEKFAGKLAVGFVIRNRAEFWHMIEHDVCLQENQFECFNTGNPRLPKLLKIAQDFEGSNQEQLSFCYAAAEGAMGRNLGSNVGRATFYKVTTAHSPWFEKVVKAGTLVKVAEIGAHEFFEEQRYRKEA